MRSVRGTVEIEPDSFLDDMGMDDVSSVKLQKFHIVTGFFQFMVVIQSAGIHRQLFVFRTVRDENTLRRELMPLQKINDHYRKYILTLDEDPDADYNGIIRTNAINWLLR